MRQIYCIIVLVISMVSTFAQQATITFVTDKDCEIFIYKPIDGGYNDKIPTKRLIVASNQATTYMTKVSPYLFILCKVPQYQQSCSLLVLPDDSLQVHLSTDGITFHGKNEAGQQYYYDNFEKYPDLDRYLMIQNVFKEYLDNKREIHTIIPAMDDSLQISAQFKRIKDLPLHTNTAKTYSDILQKEVYMYIHTDIISHFKYLISNDQKSRYIPPKDSIAIRQIIDSIYKKLPVSYELLQYPSNIYAWKYFDIYSENKEFPQGYDPNTFGPYKTYLFAPAEMQPTLLGHACMVQLKYDSGEMNLTKLKQFFNERFPESEYTAIINERVKEENDSIGEPVADLFFIKDKIDFLTQLKNVPELEGKYLYIDLWASWCMPCRAEFSYKEQVHQILESYKNVATVYISIDYDKQEKAWQNCIKNYKLSGFHLRASSALQQDIQKQVYGTDRYDIPRYVLISPTGVVLHKDLPRPSDYPKLKETLDKLMRQ